MTIQDEFRQCPWADEEAQRRRDNLTYYILAGIGVALWLGVVVYHVWIKK